MGLPKWLDRLWLALIAVAFCVMAPLWIIIGAERMGWPTMLGLLGAALLIRYYSTSPK